MHRPAGSPKDIGLADYVCAGHITFSLFHSFPVSYIRRNHAHLLGTFELPFGLIFFVKGGILILYDQQPAVSFYCLFCLFAGIPRVIRLYFVISIIFSALIIFDR